MANNRAARYIAIQLFAQAQTSTQSYQPLVAAVVGPRGKRGMRKLYVCSLGILARIAFRARYIIYALCPFFRRKRCAVADNVVQLPFQRPADAWTAPVLITHAR